VWVRAGLRMEGGKTWEREEREERENGGKKGREEERGRGIEESRVEWNVGEESMWGKKGYRGVAGEEESENGGGGGRE